VLCCDPVLLALAQGQQTGSSVGSLENSGFDTIPVQTGQNLNERCDSDVFFSMERLELTLALVYELADLDEGRDRLVSGVDGRPTHLGWKRDVPSASTYTRNDHLVRAAHWVPLALLTNYSFVDYKHAAQLNLPVEQASCDPTWLRSGAATTAIRTDDIGY